jgi:hypothetical protein
MDAAAVLSEVGAWEGVDAAGGELRHAGRLLGRLGAAGAEIAFPPRIAAMLVETGRAEAHAEPRLVRFAGETDEAIELFRLAYERARVAERVRRAGSGPP